MPREGESWTQLLVRSSRLVSEADDPRRVLPLLVEEMGGHVGAPAAAGLTGAGGEGLRVAASAGLPPALEGWEAEPDLIGPELGTALLAAAGSAYAGAYTIPLVASGDLYGVLVLLTDAERLLGEHSLGLATGLGDL